MATIFELPTFTDERGSLTVIERLFEFDIKRVYYIYECTNLQRGGHRHKKTKQCLICIKGQCEVYCQNIKGEELVFALNSPRIGLYLDPEDWHTMENFSDDCILLVLASEYYEKNDYIDEKNFT